MEDKLKDVFDHLDEKETDMFIKDIDVDNAGLNEDNIRKMVFGKLELDAPKKSHKRVIHFSWKLYSIVATAACFALLIGTVFVPMITKRDSTEGTTVNVADAEPPSKDGSDSVPASDDEKDEPYVDNEAGSEDADEEADLDSGKPSDSSKDNDKKDDKDDKDNDKDNGKDKDDKDNDGKKPGPVKDGHSSQIAAGTNKDDFGTLSSDEVDVLLSESADDIDMDSFGAEFPSLDDMIRNSEYVVKGTKTASGLVSREGADDYDLYAEFEISTVLCNNTENDIKDKVRVKEGIIYNADTECYTHVGGYAYMKTGKEYILFINKLSRNKYELAGQLCGKVPCDTEETELCLDGDFMGNDDIKKIKGIISKARDKYSSNESAVTVTSEPNATASPSPTASAEPDSADKGGTDAGKDDSGKNEEASY